MLKLIISEFKTPVRVFLILFGMALVLAFLTVESERLFNPDGYGEKHILTNILFITFILFLILAIGGYNVYRTVRNFYSHFYGCRAAFMLSLPISMRKALLVELASAVSWWFLCAVFIGVIGGILSYGIGSMYLPDNAGAALASMGKNFLQFVLVALLISAGITVCILFMYLCVSLAQLVPHRKKLLSAVLFIAGSFLYTNPVTIYLWIKNSSLYIEPILFTLICSGILGALYFFLVAYIIPRTINVE